MLYLILFNYCFLHFFFVNFTCVTMMVFNVCVNDTKYYPSNGRQLLIAHVTLITTVMIDGCQCITMVQNFQIQNSNFFQNLKQFSKGWYINILQKMKYGLLL